MANVELGLIRIRKSHDPAFVASAAAIRCVEELSEGDSQVAWERFLTEPLITTDDLMHLAEFAPEPYASLANIMFGRTVASPLLVVVVDVPDQNDSDEMTAMVGSSM